MGGPYAPPSAAECMACVAPVLCLQPMTAGDARYDAGRRAGLLEAAEQLRSLAAAHAGAQLGTVRGILCDLYRVMADELQAKAGAP